MDRIHRQPSGLVPLKPGAVEAWWRDQLAGPLPVFDPPTDRPRPPVRSFQGSCRRLALEPALRDGLRELGYRHGATLATTLLAAWSVLLHRWTGQDDLLVGSLTARQLVPYRSRLSGEEPSFAGYLAAVRSRVLDVEEHGSLSFARLIRLLRLPRDRARAPLVQAVLGFGIPPAIRSVRFDVALHVLDSAAAPLLQLDYRTDLFNASTMDRLLNQFSVLLEGIVAAPEARLGDLPLLSEVERCQVLVEWRGVAREFPAEVPVHRVFEQVAARQPEAQAVIWEAADGEHSLSYGELARHAARLAQRLHCRGVGPGVPVALDLSRSPEMVTAMVAVLQAGGFYVPLDPADGSERRSHLLADSRAAVVLTSKDLKDSKDSKDEEPFVSSALGGDALAYVLYTSGSTGRPKGVGIPHRAINRLVLETDYFHLGPGDRITNLVNTAFDVTTWEIWGALLLGATIVVVPREVVLEPLVLAEWLVRYHIDVSYLPVSVYNEITREKPWALSAVRELFSGGEALTPRWIRESLPYIARGHRLSNGYGPTECTCYALTYRIESLAEGRSVPIGRPIPNTRAYVVDREMRLLPVGVAGELCLGGPGLAQGYWHRAELTAERFVPDPFGGPGERLYRTGDLSRWLPDGTVEYLGRTDHQVKVRGYRIEPGEIEAVLSRCPGVVECAVVVRGESEGKHLVAFVSPEEGTPAPEVRSYLRARLPEYMVPAQVVLQALLPKTPSGKIDRLALLSVEVSEEVGERSYESPQTPVEEIVAGVWAEVLGTEHVGLGESFFDLGGHSLLAGRVLARLRSAFGIDLPLRSFFVEPTVGGLARRVEEAQGGALELPPILPVPRDGRIPLSFAQQGLWFLDRLAPASALYNMPVLLRIDGPLRVGSLVAAVGEIVRRHESLRTVFLLDGEEPVQRILPAIPGTAMVDLSALPGPLRRAEAERQERDAVRRPFSLETGPLFRPLLLRLSPGEHCLILAAHHIVTDGWSVRVLSQELAMLYRAARLPELSPQYADFSVWQREWLQEEALEEHLAWWKERLAGLPAGLELPAGRPRPSVQSYRGALQRAELPAALFQALLRLGRQHGATPFMTLAAAFLTLIQRHTDRDDLAVGFPSANRTRPEVEPLIGLFVNTLVLRADLSGSPRFVDLIGRVREAALGAWAHQDLPFERLVEELAPERDLSRSPLFQVLFAYQGTLLGAPELAPEISVRLEEADTGTAKFDLSLFLREGAGGGLVAELEHSTDLFDDVTIRRLLERLEILLGGIVAAPQAPLAELPLLAEAERRQVLEEWTGSETAYPSEMPIHEVFARVAQRQPGAPAVIWEEGSLTYAELDRWSLALAGRLRALGVGPEVPVALDMERSPELIVAMLAVLRAGGFYVPLDPADTSERRAYLLADSRAAVRLEAKDIKDTNDDLSLSSLVSLRSFGAELGGGALAYVLYTSGSSGTPKGVAVPHRAINRLVLETDYVRLGPGDRTAHLSNTAFDASTFEVWGALLTGAALVVIPHQVVLSPAALGEALRRWRISASFLTAALFNEVLREAPGTLAGVRNLLAGGEALSPRWVREALSQAEPGSRLLNGYGPTECTTFAVVHDIRSAPEGRSIPIGRPIANTRAWVLDRGMRPVPVGVAGELFLGGDGLARGYWQRPDLSAERFMPAPFGPEGARVYRTGDLVRWLDDGALEFLDRLDEQVKIRGFRIEPGEIESVLSCCPGVGECAVVARQEGEGKILVACATRTGAARPDVRSYLRERLPEHMVPSRVAFVDALPRTPSGKVDRRALQCSSVEPSVDVRVPRTPVEEIVAGIWAEVLGVERVGLGETFFDLGGHSLLAGRVLVRLRKAFGIELPLRAFFVDSTVEGVARRVEQVRQEGGAPELPPIRPILRDGRIPLSFAQQRLWFFDRLAPGSALYNLPAVLRIAGPLRIAPLIAAVAEIVRRHEALRTVFALAGDEPVQRILPEIAGTAVVDLSNLPEAACRSEAARQEREEVRRPFSLESGPLFRSLLFRLGPQEHRLILHAHHVVSDGWSMGVLSHELEALYRAPSALPELAVQYADFAVWQRGWLQGRLLESQLAWWQERLAGLPAGLDLPADRPRPAVQSYRGGVETAALPVLPSRALVRLGRRHGATPFMTLAAAFLALIHRHTNRDDLAVGFPTANRTQPEIEPLIGFFVNTLVLRADLSGEPGFVELLDRVREVALGAWVHQDLPFERLVEALAPERELSRSPLIQVLFAYQDNVRMEPDLAPDLSTRVEQVDTGTSKFDFSLFLRPEAGGELIAEAEYSTDLFEAGTVRRFLERLAVLVDGIVAAPEARLGDLPLLSEAERCQVLVEWRGAAREFPAEVPVHRVFEQVAAHQPEAQAVIWEAADGEHSLSYGELARHAARLARRLHCRGVGPGVPVALDLSRSPEMVTAMVAVLQAGGFYVPLDPADGSERRSHLLADSRAAVVLTSKDLKDSKDSKDEEPFVSSALGGDALAYVLYTSGSTGRPKGVGIPHRAINRLVLETDYFHLGPGDRITNLVNTAFDVTTWEIWGALLLGATIVVVPREVVLEPLVLAEWLVRYRIDVSYLPVSVYNEITREKPWALSAVRELFSGGEALTPRWIRESLPYIARGHRLSNGYGPTECTCYALTHRIESLAEGRSVPIGRPIPNTRAYVVDREMRPLPVGVAGELCLEGPGLAQGYWHRAKLTAERFVPDPFGGPGERLYRTGDLSRWLPDGTVEYLGRTDHQVKVRGYRIEPGEIETVLSRCPGVVECAVVVRGESEGKHLVAFASPEEGAAAPEVRSYLRARLPEYMVPAQVVLQASLPKTPSGKIDRLALLSVEVSEEVGERSYESPRTPVDEIVAGVWAEVLGTEHVGLGESFFDLGGHSLLAGRVLARLRSAFGIDLPLRAFFVEPTVGGLARRVEEAQGGAAELPPILPVPRDGRRIPLSFAQQRLWFLDRLAPASALYNMPAVLQIRGPLRVGPLVAAIGEIVRRHESLRTVFVLDGEEPVQRILPAIPGLAMVDLSTLPEVARRAEAARQEREELRRPFSLERGPLFRSLLFRLGPEEHRLILHAHHIVSDGWSMGVLSHELEALYRVPSALPELAVQYADFAVWQREWLQGGLLESQLAWWQERLAGLPAGLDLPADRPRPAVQSYHGAMERAALPAVSSMALLRLGRQYGATPFMTLATAFLALLQRYTDREDLALGFPSANRTRPEIEPLIGFFVNTLVLRTDLSGEPGFLDLLGRVREAALGAWAHQDLPFERLVEELAPERDLSRSPLVQVIFAYQDTIRMEPQLAPNLSTCMEQVDTGTAKFDLSLLVAAGLFDQGSTLEGWIEYNTDLFDRSTMARLAGHLRRLVDAVVADPGAHLSRLVLLSPAERHQVLVEWNRTGTPLPGGLCVHQLVARRAQEQPDAVAMAGEDGALTYAELVRRAELLARRLRRMGIEPESRVGVLAERSPEMVTGLLAVLQAGGAYLPIDPAYPSERITFMLDDARAPVLLTTRALSGRVSRYEGRVLLLEEEAVSGEGTLPEVDPGQLAYVIYTSGSTGRPKGVQIEHRSLLNLVEWHRREYGIQPSDRATLVASPGFDASVWEVWPYLSAGASLHVPPEVVRSEPSTLAAWLVRERITISFLPTPLAEAVLEEPWNGTDLHTLLTGGDALHRGADESAPFELVNHYGPTENTVVATATPVVRGARRPPIGRPISNVRVYVLDSRLQPQPVGVPGELFIGGGSLARGYLERPDLTAERFVPDPFGPLPGKSPGGRLYRTGDRVRHLPEGSIDFLGRVDLQVKVRGFRIELGEVEAALREHPAVREAAAAVWGDPRRLVAYVAAEDRDGLREELQGLLATRLPSYMVPSAFVVLPELPLGAHGKIDRAALPAPVAEAICVEPRTPLERRLAGMWADLLPGGAVGVHDGFFERGGHSLLATRLLARVGRELGVSVPLGRFLQAPTVAELARRLEEALGVLLPPLVPATRGGRFPLSFPQQRLWFMDRLAPDSHTYNIPEAFALRGHLDVAALAAALAGVVDRHAVLRTRFVEVDGQPWQEILPGDALAAFLPIPLLDLSGLHRGEQEQELARLGREEAARPFLLSRGPLLRAGLVRMGQEEHVLLVTLHHIASDGWSEEILKRELSALYAGSPLTELPIQYADFALWQRSWPEEVLAGQVGWWTRRLAGLSSLEVPTDRVRPPVQTFRGAASEIAVPPALAAALRDLSHARRSTLFMTLLAAWQALFHRVTGQADVAVGSPVANRNRPEIEGLIGFFVNLLALRTDCGGDPSFEGLLERVRRTALEAYDHADVPFERIIDELSVERDLSRQALVQVMFSLHTPAPQPAFRGLESEPLALADAVAKFDLTLGLFDRGEGLDGWIEHSTDLFDRSTVARLSGWFLNLLASAVERPDRRLSELELLSPAERHQLLGEWNDTAAPFPEQTLMHQFFEAAVDRDPGALAAVWEGRELTYAGLEERANRVANLLRRRGVGRGTPVGVWMERSLDMVAGVLAVLKAGGYYVPLDPAWPVDRVESILRETGAPALLTRSGHLGRVLEMQWRLSALATVVCLDVETPEPAPEPVDEESVRAVFDLVSERAVDRVTAGGFVSSFTGEPFAEAEVDEYRDRVLSLAEPWIGPERRVLEIGSGSGLLMWEIAPRVGRFVGLDPSPLTQERNRARAAELGLDVELPVGFAHEIEGWEEGSFDLVLIASTAQFFPGPLYLERVVKQAFRLLGPGGAVVIADVPDARRQEELGSPRKVLSVDEGFFRDLGADVFHRETGFDNELRFRYDVVLTRIKARSKSLLTSWHVERCAAERPPAVAAPEDLAYVIHTSGSTGQPKGIVVQHRPVANLIAWINPAFGLGPSDRVLFVTSLCFDLSVWDVFGVLAASGCVHVASEEDLQDAERLMRLLLEEPVTIWDSAPAALVRLAPLFPSMPAVGSRLRRVMLSGDWIPVTLPDRVRAAFPHAEVTSLGGATEATVWSNWYPIGEVDPAWPSIPYGRPMPNAQYHVLDAGLTPCPIGVPGDLYIGGDCLCAGYAHQPDLTAASFVPDPFGEPGARDSFHGALGARLYRTGDRARCFPDGNLEFLGRVDQQVKIRGFRIELGEIELALARHRGVREAVVLAREAVPGDPRLVAYVVPAAGELPDLREFLRRWLPEYMIPAVFVELESLPVTANGKLDRRALPAPHWESAESAGPGTPMQQALAALWREILGVERVGVHDSFFDLGGHSLLATQLVARIRAAFQVEMPLRTVFQSPTLEAMAEVLAAASSAASGPVLRPVPRQGELPLSASQLRQWFLVQLEPESVDYNLPVTVRLEGELRVAALADALRAVVRRHEALRTTFVATGGRPAAVIAPEVHLPLAVLDLSSRPEAEREAETLRVAMADSERPFDLTRGPLLRALLIRLGEAEHLLALTVHHIVFDGFSMAVFLRELSALYEAEISGRPADLPELTVQYVDYAAWQQEQLCTPVLRAKLERWKERLAGASQVLDLPTDRPRPAMLSLRGEMVPATVPADQTAEIRKLAGREGVTLFMALLTGYAALLSRYTGQEDLNVGTFVANRPQPALERLIGFFVNTLVLRVDLTGDPSFRELLARVREMSLEAFENQEVPFERLLDELETGRDLSRGPLFQAMFGLQNFAVPTLEAPGLTLRPVGLLEHARTNGDIAFWISEDGDELSALLQLSTDLYDASTVTRMFGHLKRLLTGGAGDPGLRLSALPLLSAEETVQILVEWNRPGEKEPEPDGLVHERLERWARVRPDAIALETADGREILTYAELNRRGNHLAHRLRRLGVRTDSIVGIWAERSVELVVGVLGILKAGGAYMPLDPTLPADRLSALLRGSGSSVLLARDGRPAALPPFDGEVVALRGLSGPLEDDRNPAPWAVPESLVYVLFTSGSTGMPKGVLIPHSALANFAETTRRLYGIGPQDRVLQFCSLVFDISVEEIFTSWTAGATLVLRDEEMVSSPARFLRACGELGLQMIDLPTAWWHELGVELARGEVSLPSCVRSVVFAGERALLERMAGWQEALRHGVRLFNSYGPAEATPANSVFDPAEPVSGMSTNGLSIGKPMRGARLYAVDFDLRPVPVSVAGELLIAGAGVGRGYAGRPDLTAERFVPDPFSAMPGERVYRTGDRVRWLRDGNLEFLGRVDDQVKIRGFRIEPGEIAAVICGHPGVREAVVVPREAGAAGLRLVAYAAADPGTTAAELREWVKSALPAYMVPADFVLLDALPLTATGKLDRRALPEPATGEAAGYAPPETATEELLAAIWAGLLGRERVGIYDNFFDLGGHSLLAPQVFSRIEETFQVELPLRTLFEAPTVAQLANLIERELLAQIEELSDQEAESLILSGGT